MSEFKSNVRSDAFWLRTLYVVAFFLVYRVIDLLLLLLTVVQWFFRLFTGQPQAELAVFATALGVYVQQIVHYLAGSSEEKPYPFQDWPAVRSAEPDGCE